ncbi:MAG: sensor signal transduction histidine kinase, partial [Deltaproteobacteria bacterium]|nr:sensor signal transduction histidine kinase [Deltaproteobacteria bacterium]
MSDRMDKQSFLALLTRVIEISNSNILVENRLKSICDLLCREGRIDCICIYRREPRGEDLVPWISSSLGIDECSRLDFSIRTGEGIAGKAAYRRAPIFFPDIKGSPPAQSIAEELRDFASILSVPVMDDVYLYGVMNLSSIRPARYSEEERAFFQVVATEAAGAIRNSKLYHDARKRVSELITLNEIGRAIISSFDVKDILEYVSKATTRLLSAGGCTVRLAGDGRQGLRVMVDEGFDRVGLRREARVLARKLALQVFQQRRPLLVNGPEDSPFYDELSQRGVVSFLGLPIVSKERSLGVISYYSTSSDARFDMEAVHLMQTVCSQLANMVEHATTLEKARRLAQENQDKVRRISALYDIARVMMSTVNTERLLQAMLFSLVSPEGLKFSRAILFLLSEDGRRLVGRMAMGPRDRKEVRVIDRLPREILLNGSGEGRGEIRDLLWPEVEKLHISLSSTACMVARSVLEKRPIRAEGQCPVPPEEKPSGFCSAFCGAQPSSFAAVPLMIKGEARGAVFVDNMYRDRDLTDEDIQVLTTFASNASLAMETVSLYESLENALHTVRSTQDRLLQSEKLTALGEMAARIAHEIKNPLTVIGGFARRMARPEKPTDDRSSVARYAQIILKEVQRLERIIHETLYFSRDVSPELRSVDLNHEVLEALSMFREELQEARITTEVDLSPELPVIFADPDQIVQVLWNLVNNAIQAMEGSGALTISTRPAVPPQEAGVVIRVTDTGGGIPHDVVHNIFNPFFTTKAKGTGLGLPIVHAIVERHGGTIHLDNQEGKGVTFSIFLPLFPKEAGAADRILDQMRK